MRQLSPCVKPQVLVARMSRPLPPTPQTSHPSPPPSLPPFRLMRKGERIPRSGGLLHSALLISQAPPIPTACLSLDAAQGLQLVSDRLLAQIPGQRPHHAGTQVRTSGSNQL